MNAMPRHTLRALRRGVLLLFGSTLLSRCATMMTVASCVCLASA